MKITESIETFNNYQDFFYNLSEDERREVQELRKTNRYEKVKSPDVKASELNDDDSTEPIFIYRLWRNDKLQNLYCGQYKDLPWLLKNKSSFHEFEIEVVKHFRKEFYKSDIVLGYPGGGRAYCTNCNHQDNF